jgi:hypothetical protein
VGLAKGFNRKFDCGVCLRQTLTLNSQHRDHARPWKPLHMLLSIIDSVPWYYWHLKTLGHTLFRQRFAHAVFEIRVFSGVLYIFL